MEDKELTTSKIEGKQFYLGQLELGLIVKRIIRHYRYHNNNQDPQAVIIPLLKEVDGVKVIYEREVETKPRADKSSEPDSPDNSQI